MTNAAPIDAAWFPDPHDPNGLRWWDGTTWTEHVAPNPATAPHAAPSAAPVAVQPQAHGHAPVVAAGGGEWQHPRYLVHQKVAALGSRYELLLPTESTVGAEVAEPGRIVAVVQRKRVSIKERITFRDEREVELFSIVAPKAISIAQRYEVRLADGTVVGQLRKRIGMSFWRTRWVVLDASEQVVATAQESSGLLAFARRFGDMLPFGFVADLIPYDFTITSGDDPSAGGQLGSYRRRRGLRDRYDLDLRADPGCRLDRRLAVSLAVALDVLQNR